MHKGKDAKDADRDGNETEDNCKCRYLQVRSFTIAGSLSSKNQESGQERFRGVAVLGTKSARGSLDEGQRPFTAGDSTHQRRCQSHSVGAHL
jgi:hypothetical protein